MIEKQIKIEGFTSNLRSTEDLNLVIGSFGIQGAGKTRFWTTCPDPIGVIPTNRKTRRTAIDQAELTGKQIFMPEEDFIRHGNPVELAMLDDKKTREYYAKHVENMLKAAYRLAAHPDIRTIVVDDFSQFCEDVLFKHYGRTWRIMPRDRGPYNQDIIDFINGVSAKNVVLTHKSAEIWENKTNAKGEETGTPTGKFKQKGFGDLGYHCNVVIEMKKNPAWDQNGNGKIPWKYSIDIRDCQSRPELEGPQGKDLLTDEFITFGNLAMEIFPNEDPARFM